MKVRSLIIASGILNSTTSSLMHAASDYEEDHTLSAKDWLSLIKNALNIIVPLIALWLKNPQTEEVTTKEDATS